MKKPVEILAALVACYYDPQSHKGSTVPFAGTLTDAEILKLWIAAAKQIKTLDE
jgi:hypothetical protein